MSELNDVQLIGRFEVTDRNFQKVLEIFGLNEADIDNFCYKATVLNMGSGLHRVFEKTLFHRRQDLQILSIDPTLGIVTIDKNGNTVTQGFRIDDHYGEMASYIYDEGNRRYSDISNHDGKAIQYDKKRKLIVTEIDGAIGSLATELPIASESVDIVFDCLGPIQYLKKYEEQMKYLKELKRIIKLNGVIYMSSLDSAEIKILDDLGMSYKRTKSQSNNSFIIHNNNS